VIDIETVKWLLSRSDVEAALRLHGSYDQNRRGLEWAGLRDYTQKFWPQCFVGGCYYRIYQVAGEIEAQVDLEMVFRGIPHQWRYQILASYLQSAVPTNGVVLDYGCSRGLHAIHLHNMRPDLSFVGLDIDMVSISQASNAAYRFAKVPDKMAFDVASEATPLPDKQFSAAMLLEVLEHVIDPNALIAKVEKSVVENGFMFISLPYGPIEYNMWIDHPERLREHIREYSIDDIWDVFGQKDDLHVEFGGAWFNAHTKSYNGCHFIAYRVTGKPTGVIDYERKLSTKRKFTGELPGWSE
jgi:SAM-dependent methyltransferase